jgi:hypothetical protein
MANNKFNKYIGAIALGAVILAVPSCSDDHFDVNYESDKNSPVATKTLWELIKENSNLSKFMTIAETAKYWKDENHRVDNWTYADVLKSGQLTTVWAPENDYLSDAEYNILLERCKTDGYNLQQQFISNHMALWRKNISDSGIDTIKMINGKNMVFDKTDPTDYKLQGISLNENNIAALNGTLHTIKGITSFHYNFYEYLKFSSSLPLMTNYVVSKDTTEFYKEASIEGLPDKDGNPSYVDSVYRTTNILFNNVLYRPNSGAETWDMYQECFFARINEEDSAFIMVMPNDAAWTAAKQKMAHLYKYPARYEDKIKGNQGTSVIRDISDPDSLTNMSIDMDITTPLVFNVNKQPKIGSKLWTLEDFIANKGATAKYLLNTFGDTLRSTATWDKTSIFNGDLIEMSNGYAYEAKVWAFPRELYNPDIEVEIDGTGAFYYTTNTSTYFKVGSDTKALSFNNSLFSDISDKYGQVSHNNFYYLAAPGPTSVPHVEVKLMGNLPSTCPIVTRNNTAEVMSGKYDVYVVCVPYWYSMISNKGYIDDDFYTYEITMDGDEVVKEEKVINQHYIDSLSSISKQSFTGQLRYNNNAANGKDVTSKKSPVIEYDGTKVDTLLVFEDFEFPYSYKNLIYSYPTLILEGATKSASAKNGFIYPLYIDRVILKSKETGEETILDPQ